MYVIKVDSGYRAELRDKPIKKSFEHLSIYLRFILNCMFYIIKYIRIIMNTIKW